VIDGIARRRMHRLRLSGPGPGAAEDVVRWLGAVQSQDYGPARWSIGQRLTGMRDADIERAFAAGQLLRTHVLRPTWHFVLPADIRWLLALTAPRVHVQNGPIYRQSGLDEALLDRCAGLLTDALQGGNHLTRAELAAVLAGAGIVADGLRMGYILMYAELEAVICSGAPKGKRHTYALLEERAPAAAALDPDAALAELTRRYFTSHGPATVKDFRWWSSLTIADIRRGLDMVGPALDREVIDGVTYWSAAAAAAAALAVPAVQLLQAYDEYVVGYSESKYLLDVSGDARRTAGDRPVFNHVVIAGTQVAGHWKRTLNRDSVAIEVALYAPFHDRLDEAWHLALRAEAARHAAFLGLALGELTTRRY
jgi:Winged helix DNA-binding domain